MNEAHILLTAQYLYRSPKQKEKKEEKEQLHCDSLLLDLLQNAAVVQDKHMIGRICASGKKRRLAELVMYIVHELICVKHLLIE